MRRNLNRYLIRTCHINAWSLFQGVKGMVLHHPFSYFWLIIVSLLDISLTCVILERGGQELNPLANKVIFHAGMVALPAFKFTLLLGLVFLCEVMTVRRPIMGKTLTGLGVCVWAMPPVWAVWQLYF